MRPIGLLLALLITGSLTGCKRRYATYEKPLEPTPPVAFVKRIALVQYAINPHALLGVPLSPAAKSQAAAGAWSALSDQLPPLMTVMPFAELVAAPVYATGRPEWSGYYSAPGARFFSADENQLEQAQLSPAVAAQLCEGLGVDGVMAVYDSWGVHSKSANPTPFGPHFSVRGHSHNEHKMKLYDRTGTQVWAEWFNGDSDDYSVTERVVTTDLATFVKANIEVFGKSARAFRIRVQQAIDRSIPRAY